MNSIHNNGENDKSLNEDLDKLGRSYAGLEQDEPPELLDQAILNSAHRALEKKSRWMKFSWVHGLTTAAVFIPIIGWEDEVGELLRDVAIAVSTAYSRKITGSLYV